MFRFVERGRKPCPGEHLRRRARVGEGRAWSAVPEAGVTRPALMPS